MNNTIIDTTYKHYKEGTLIRALSKPAKLYRNEILRYWFRNLYKLSSKRIDRNITKFSQHLDIQRTIYIPLQDLSFYVTENSESKKPLVGRSLFNRKFIIKGDWDLNKRPIMPDFYDIAKGFRSMFQVFLQGMPYENTDEYIQAHDRLKNKKKNKFIRLEKIYESIKMNGYLSQQDLHRKPIAERFMEFDDIKVAIDRNGNMLRLFESGNHRLAIAIILGLEHIPVFVMGVHHDWAYQCYQKHNCHLLNAINQEINNLNARQGGRRYEFCFNGRAGNDPANGA
jgi:hypothetical protein